MPNIYMCDYLYVLSLLTGGKEIEQVLDMGHTQTILVLYEAVQEN